MTNLVGQQTLAHSSFWVTTCMPSPTTHAIELSPTLAVAYAGCAHAYEQLGRESQTFHDYQQALHYDPNYEWVKTQLAQWRQRQQQNVDDRS